MSSHMFFYIYHLVKYGSCQQADCCWPEDASVSVTLLQHTRPQGLLEWLLPEVSFP